MVANNGDGTLALFEGGDDGLSLMSTSSDPELPSPTALVYAGVDGGQVQFYAATEGREAAALVALSLGGEIAPQPGPLAPTPPVVAQLVAAPGIVTGDCRHPADRDTAVSTSEVNLESAETEAATVPCRVVRGSRRRGPGLDHAGSWRRLGRRRRRARHEARGSAKPPLRHLTPRPGSGS